MKYEISPGHLVEFQFRFEGDGVTMVLIEERRFSVELHPAVVDRREIPFYFRSDYIDIDVDEEGKLLITIDDNSDYIDRTMAMAFVELKQISDSEFVASGEVGLGCGSDKVAVQVAPTFFLDDVKVTVTGLEEFMEDRDEKE